MISPVPPTVERLPVAEGVTLHALVWPGGDHGREPHRPPFLLVHGLSSNCRTWEAVGELLAGRGHRVAAIDLRGHGLSDKPEEGYDFATLSSDVLAAIGALGFERPVVAGQSTGGNIALELGVRAPEAVAGIVGVDGGVLELQDQWPQWDDCKVALAPPPITGRPAAWMEGMIRRGHPDWAEWGVAATMANLEVRDDGTVAPWLTPARHLQILRALWEQRPSSLLPALRVALLLVSADTGDSWTEGKRLAVERALSLAPAARAAWFVPGDHDLHVQHPDDIADLLTGAVSDGFFPS